MKRITCLLLLLMLVFGIAAAEQETELGFDAPVSVDLNGDGEIEEIRLQMVGTEEESYLMLVLIGGDGGVNTFMTNIMFSRAGNTKDLNGDGKMEIYLTGDQCSDDFVTWCLAYSEQGLKNIPFPNFERDGTFAEDAEYGYGYIEDMAENMLTLTGTQDILGTWFASRTLSQVEDHFEFSDDGMFVIQNGVMDSEFWEYAALNLIRPLNFTSVDGNAGVLEPGQRIALTKSDLENVVYFVTQDGTAGYFHISPNVQDGWGVCIDGLAEYEYFEYLPYAD